MRKVHAKTPSQPQHRIQAPSRRRVSCRRDPERHDLSRNLVRVWVEKAETGAFDDEEVAAELLSGYEARIAALERLVGRQALEIDFLKGAVRSRTSPRSAHTSVTSGPAASPSGGDAN